MDRHDSGAVLLLLLLPALQALQAPPAPRQPCQDDSCRQASCAAAVVSMAFSPEPGGLAVLLQESAGWLPDFLRRLPAPHVILSPPGLPAALRCRSLFLATAAPSAEELLRRVARLGGVLTAVLWLSNATGGLAESHLQDLAVASWDSGVPRLVLGVWSSAALALFQLSPFAAAEGCRPRLRRLGSVSSCSSGGLLDPGAAASLSAYASSSHVLDFQGCELRVATARQPPHVILLPVSKAGSSSNSSTSSSTDSSTPPSPAFSSPRPDATASERTSVTGINAEFLQELSRRLKAKLSYVLVTDGTGGGFVSRDGNATGALAELQSRRAELASGSFQLTPDRVQLVDFEALQPPLPLVVVVPRCARRRLAVHWTGRGGLVAELSGGAWVLLGVSILAVAATELLLSRVASASGSRRLPPTTVVLTVAGCLAEVPVPGRWTASRTAPEKVLLGVWIMAALVVSALIRGKLLSNMTSGQQDCDIRSLADLAESGLPLFSPRATLRIESARPHSELESRVLRSARDVRPHEVADKIRSAAERRDAAVFVELEQAVFLEQQIGCAEQLHRFVAFSQLIHGTLMLWKRSPLRPYIARICLAVDEAGLWRVWYDKYVKAARPRATKRIRPLRMKDMEIAFVVLTNGLMAAAVWFLIETACGLCRLCRCRCR